MKWCELLILHFFVLPYLFFFTFPSSFRFLLDNNNNTQILLPLYFFFPNNIIGWELCIRPLHWYRWDPYESGAPQLLPLILILLRILLCLFPGWPRNHHHPSPPRPHRLLRQIMCVVMHQCALTRHRRIFHGRTRTQTPFPFPNLHLCHCPALLLAATMTVVNFLDLIHCTPVHHWPCSVSGAVPSVRIDEGQNDVPEEVSGVGSIIIIPPWILLFSLHLL